MDIKILMYLFSLIVGGMTMAQISEGPQSLLFLICICFVFICTLFLICICFVFICTIYKELLPPEFRDTPFLFYSVILFYVGIVSNFCIGAIIAFIYLNHHYMLDMADKIIQGVKTLTNMEICTIIIALILIVNIIGLIVANSKK